MAILYRGEGNMPGVVGTVEMACCDHCRVVKMCEWFARKKVESLCPYPGDLSPELRAVCGECFDSLAEDTFCGLPRDV